MKKLLILIVIAITATLSCKAQTYINTQNGDTLKLFPKKTVVIPPPVVVVPPIADISILSAQEQLFDNIWYANGSAAVGSEVSKLNTKKGGIDINYNGRTSKPGPSWPAVAIDGKLPIMVDANSLEFNNRASLQYESAQVTPIQPPYEQWFVFRLMPSAVYEAMFEDGVNRGYIANNGNTIRILGQSYILPNSTWPSLFQTHIGRLVINDGKSATLWIDNINQGTLQVTGSDINNLAKGMFNVGVVTNNADWDFMALYFKSGLLADPNTLYTSLASKWSVGAIPNQILINNLGWTKTTAKVPVYTPQATVVNTPKGITVADPSKWDYQWIYWVGATYLNVQTIFSTKYQITTADFPAGYANMQGLNFKLRIRPKDTNGNSWRWFESNGQPY